MKKKKKAAPNEWRIREVDNSDRCWWWLASLFMAAILAVIVVSCTEEPVQPGAEEEGLPATIRLEVMPDAATQAQTRVDENAINNLHVLLYNSSGELVAKNYTTGSTVTLKTRSGSGYKIYAIANTGNSTLFDGAVASTETKLQAMNTADLSSWDGLTTASHLVMMGSKTGVAISAGSSTLSGGISVVRLAAKVTLNIGVKSGSGITITNYQVFSLPKQSRYVPGTTDGATSWINGASTTVNGTSVDKTFFMYENRRGVVSSITAQKDKVASKAPGYATYVIINGEANGYNAIWRVYLGENNTNDFNIKRNGEYTYNITLSRPSTDGIDTRVDICPIAEGGNSNSYMITPFSGVTIPVERANESYLQIGTSRMLNGKCIQLEANTAWSASIVWESSKGLITLNDATGTGTSRFKVIATNKTTEGNAVVAIRNTTTKDILWSWHIWVTNYAGNNTSTMSNGIQNYEFMDRNLGAMFNQAGDVSAIGLHYQWGRKDPFPVPITWEVANNTDPTNISKQAIPIGSTSNNLTLSIRQPQTFLYSTVSSDWFVDTTAFLSGQDHNLWGGANLVAPNAKTVFDPCPTGWRVPFWSGNYSPYEKFGNGINTIYGKNYGEKYWPYSGMRYYSNGNFYGIGYSMTVQSASPNGQHGSQFGADASGGAVSVHYRSLGYSVRCVKE